MQTLFLPDAPGCTGRKPTVLMATFLVGELLSELESEAWMDENLENRVCVCVCVVCSVLGKNIPPFDSDEKALAVKFERERERKGVK